MIPTNGGKDNIQSGGDIDNNLGTGNNIGAIGSGVAGALLAVLALLVLIVVVILVIFIVRRRNQRLKETDDQGML